MLKIKLARFGKRNQPEYRIVVNEAKDKRDGQYLVLLGTYSPARSPKVLTIDMKLAEAWIAKGAQPTETVQSLLTRYQSGNPFPAKKAKPSRKKLTAAAAKKAEGEAKAEEKVDTKVKPTETKTESVKTTKPTETTTKSSPSAK